MTAASIPWIKKIEEAVEEAKLIPLWGGAPPFPWDAFSSELAKRLEIEKLEIQPQNTDWKKSAELLEGAGSNPIIIPIELAPIPGTVFWIVGQEDVSRMVSHALTSERKSKGFADREYQEGFYRYICLESLSILDQLKAFQDLSVKMKSRSSLPDQDGLCVDVSIKMNQHSAWGRMVCPKDVFHAIRAHFLNKKKSILDQDLAQKIEASVHFEIGNVSLRFDQWKRVKTGDLVILDRCSFDPQSGKGTVVMMLENTPLFRAKIRHNKIKILDYAYYYEENKLMSNDHSDEEEQKDEAEDSGETENEEETFSEMEFEKGEKIDHLWSSETGGKEASEKIISTHQIPVTLSIEVARLRMTLDKVLQLQPGNTIELAVEPEAGVDITINGKKIARGELIKLGEMLGVKILQVAEA
ncbi:MAG TPA: type III secretion system cytoplasmic ring protein SctQ [Rhabdochlamydiaceae bacterium]|nr:type III secretion system cytoplasmic ring protein SctQ [Rhabdochlamydiaceae bacterium]